MSVSFNRRVELALWARESAFLPDLAAPEDWPAAANVETTGCPPLWQGSYLPSLSGAFAAVNAVRLAAARERCLTSREEQELLATAMRWKADRGYSGFARGLRRSDWPRLLEALCEFSSRHIGKRLFVSQPWRYHCPDYQAFMVGLERLIVGHNVVAVLLAGANYSVIRGYTPLSLLLFDSGGRRWISREAISLPGEAKRTRHHLVPAATMTLTSSW